MKWLFLPFRMCIVCIANIINRNVYIYLNTRIFPTTGYARVLLFMLIRRELGGMGTGCLFQFTYCAFIKFEFSGNPQCSYVSPYDIKNTKMLYGDDMFLSTILLKLFGAVNGHY